MIVASPSKPNSQVGESLISPLYDDKLKDVHVNCMLFKGEDRPQGDAGQASIQE